MPAKRSMSEHFFIIQRGPDSRWDWKKNRTETWAEAVDLADRKGYNLINEIETDELGMSSQEFHRQDNGQFLRKGNQDEALV